MEELVDEGLTKSIGLSNFNIAQIREILDNVKTHRPQVLQNECHPYLQLKDLLDFCKINRIQLQVGEKGYSCLTCLSLPPSCALRVRRVILVLLVFLCLPLVLSVFFSVFFFSSFFHTSPSPFLGRHTVLWALMIDLLYAKETQSCYRTNAFKRLPKLIRRVWLKLCWGGTCSEAWPRAPRAWRPRVSRRTTTFGTLSFLLKIWPSLTASTSATGCCYGQKPLLTQTIPSRMICPTIMSSARLQRTPRRALALNGMGDKEDVGMESWWELADEEMKRVKQKKSKRSCTWKE